MTVYIVDIESVPTRYTCEWKTFLPQYIKESNIDVVVIDGGNVPQTTTPGAFLNFAGTNSYKSQQLLKIADMFAAGTIKDNDYFLYTDAWNPTVIQLRYMAELLGIKIKIGGLWHAGSYDFQDFLGRLVGDKPWVRNAEASMFYCYDDVFFATRFHSNMFFRNLFDVRIMFDYDETEEWINDHISGGPKVHIVGWPMEYLKDILAPYTNIQKKNKIIFPHRIAPEKQIEIFKDLADSLPEYEWFVAQEQPLTKHEYHMHLAESKLLFSASLQETLGISTGAEGPLCNTVPLCPDRLSYSEIFEYTEFLYPSEWTINFENYLKHKSELIERIRYIMENDHSENLKNYRMEILDQYFHSNKLISTILFSIKN